MRAATVRRCCAASMAFALAISSSVALAASASALDDADDKPGCRELGCDNGARLCGTITMLTMESYWFMDYMLALPVYESWACYEKAYA